MAVMSGGTGKPVYGRDVKASGNKDVAVAGTAVALTASTTEIDGVFIKPKEDNTGKVFCGDSTVDSTGYALSPTDPPMFYPASDLAEVYIDCEGGNTDGVYYWPI